MDAETKAALETYRAVKGGADNYTAGEHLLACVRLADAYLVEHPADDDDPIDDDFAWAVGQRRFQNGLKLELLDCTNHWEVFAMDFEGDCVLLLAAKTKVQVRRLIAALEGK